MKQHECSPTCWQTFPLFRAIEGYAMATKAVFLDRDNTLIEDPGYIADPSLVKLLPGAETALKSLAQAGYQLVVVTNQSGIARGMLTEETLGKIHDELRRQLAAHGAKIDAVYYCPFHPEGSVEQYAMESDLRKPRPGMLLQAAQDLNIDLAASWTVGDSDRDVEAGQRAGTRTIRIKAKHGGTDEPQQEEAAADYVVRNIVEAARIIVRGEQPGVVTAALKKSTSEKPARSDAPRPVDPATPPLPGLAALWERIDEQVQDQQAQEPVEEDKVQDETISPEVPTFQPATAPAAAASPANAEPRAEQATGSSHDTPSAGTQSAHVTLPATHAAPASTSSVRAAVEPPPAPAEHIQVESPKRPHADRWGHTDDVSLMSDDQLRRETLRLLRQLTGQGGPKPFSASKLVAGVCLAMAVVLLPTGLIITFAMDLMRALPILLTAMTLAALASALYVMNRD